MILTFLPRGTYAIMENKGSSIAYYLSVNLGRMFQFQRSKKRKTTKFGIKKQRWPKTVVLKRLPMLALYLTEDGDDI